MKTLLAAATLALTISAGAFTAHAQGPMPPPPGGPFPGREFGPPPPPGFDRPPMPPPPHRYPHFGPPRHARPLPPPEPPGPPPPRFGPPLAGFLRFVFER